MNSFRQPLVLLSVSCILSISALTLGKPSQATTPAGVLIASNPMALGASGDPLTGGQGTERAGASPLELMQNAQVKKELNITEDQSKKIKKINDTLQQNMTKITANVNWAALKDDKKKQDELEEKIKKQIQPARDEVIKVLKPEQIKRFKEISLQIYGFGVLSYDQFTKELGLTSEQETKLNKLRQETFQKVRANLEAPKDNSPASLNKAKETNKKRVEQFFKESNQQAMNVLKPEQKSKLETLKGKKFDFDSSKAAPPA